MTSIADGARLEIGDTLSPALEAAFEAAALATEVPERQYVGSLLDRVQRRELRVLSWLSAGAVAGGVCYRVVDDEAELIYGFLTPAFAGAEAAFLREIVGALARSGARVVRSGLSWPGRDRFAGAAAALGFAAASRLSMAREVDEGLMFSYSPGPGVDVRPWSPADFGAVARLMHEAATPSDRSVYPLFATPEGSRAMLLSIIQDRHGLFMPGLSAVAEAEGRFAGFVLCSLLADGSVLVIDIAVDGGLRRRGVASRLLQYLISRCAILGKRQIALAVTADNAAAIGLYQKMGFRTVTAFDQHVLKIGP